MKRIATKLAVIFIAFATMLTFMPAAWSDFVYADEITESSTVSLAPTATYNQSASQVELSWDFNSAFVSGTYVVRVNGSTTEEKNVGTVSSDYSYTKFYDKSVEPGAAYIYRLVNGTERSDWSNIVEITVPETTPDSGDSGGSGSGGDSGSGGSSDSGSGSQDSSSGSTDSGSNSSSDSEAPSLKDVAVSLSSSAAGKIDINYTSYGADRYAVYGVQVKYGSKIVLDTDAGYYSSNARTITVPYGKTVTLKYRVYKARTANSKDSERVYSSSWKTLKGQSAKLKRPTLKVTKIAKNKAGLAWTESPGATGYRIYKGKKLIKTVKAKKTKVIYTKSGAGSAKYTVQPVIKNSKMKKLAAGPKSKAKKGTANVRKFNVSKNVNSIAARYASFKVAKITLSGSTYTISGYVLNNRIFDLQKFRKMEIRIFVDGKKVASKKFTNLKCAVKNGDYRSFTVKIKGKSGVDLANAEGNVITINAIPYWKTVGASR